MKRCWLATAVAVICLCVQDSNAGTIVIEDTVFDNADWVLSNSGTGQWGSVSATQFPAGGNPGQFRSVLHSAGSPGAQTNSFHFNSTMPYDPSSEGAILSLNYSEDSVAIAGSNLESRIALRQGGQFYLSEQAFSAGASSTAWDTTKINGLAAVDFGLWFNGSLLPFGDPDFSVAGGPIEFGFFRTRFIPRSTGRPVQIGIDNWRVELTTDAVPEPSSIGLTVLGLFGSYSMRRRTAA